MISPTVEQYGASLAGSFQALTKFKGTFEARDFKDCDEAAEQLSVYWDPRFLPNFEVVNGQIRSRQGDWFTILAFAEALSEFLVGLEELSAYEVLEQKDYDQFANFASYTSCFHLVDSFLCLNGLYWLPSPTGNCEWKEYRKITHPKALGAPACELEPSRLKFKGKPVNFVLARLDRSHLDNWIFEPRDIRSLHVSRWKCFGQELQQLLNARGLESIPKQVKRFFGLFSGHLAYKGYGKANTRTAEGMRKLIALTCLDREPLVPRLRNIAVYDNRSMDEHFRLVAQIMDSSIIDSPSKLVAKHFNQLGLGLAHWQTDRLKEVLSAAETVLGRDQCQAMVRRAFLLSGMVELDFIKVVQSGFYNDLHRTIRDAIAPIFRHKRFIPLQIHTFAWNVGTSKRPVCHAIRIPATIPDVVVLQSDWFPRKKLGLRSTMS
jgi:hypothetical protein